MELALVERNALVAGGRIPAIRAARLPVVTALREL